MADAKLSSLSVRVNPMVHRGDVKRPSEYAPEAFAELTSHVGSGSYRRYDNLADVPSALSRVAGYAGEKFITTVVLGSNSSQHPPSIGGVIPASSAPIFRVSSVRWDQHGSDGEPHINKDDVLLFQDRSGRAWQLHAHDQVGHYTSLSTDAGLDVVLNQFNWPANNAGSLESLAAAGALVDFSTGKPRTTAF